MDVERRALGVGRFLLLSLAALLAPSLFAGTTNAPRTRLSDSFSYVRDTRPEGPWSVNTVRVSRARADLGLHVTLGRSNVIGLETLSGQLARFPRGLGRPLAAVNGDYFVRGGRYGGDPEGLCIADGELVSAPCEKSCFWVAPDGSYRATNVISLLSVTWPDGTVTPVGLNEERRDRPVLYTPAIGRTTRTDSGRELVLEPGSDTPLPLRPGETYRMKIDVIREGGNAEIAPGRVVLSLPESSDATHDAVPAGSFVTVSTATVPDLRGVRTAISGGPALIRGGVATGIAAGDVRHPRTAIGWNATHFYFVQVDGRQPRFSVGMTLMELTEYLLQLGCTEALNLDGGGSSTFWAQGQVMNNPCEGEERATGNGLVISLGEAARAK